MDKKNHRFSRFIKRVSKKWLRLSTEVGEKAHTYGIKRKRNVICGHTHKAARVEGFISYYNSGCWTDKPSHFLIIDKHGVHTYSEEDGKYEESNLDSKEFKGLGTRESETV